MSDAEIQAEVATRTQQFGEQSDQRLAAAQAANEVPNAARAGLDARQREIELGQFGPAIAARNRRRDRANSRRQSAPADPERVKQAQSNLDAKVVAERAELKPKQTLRELRRDKRADRDVQTDLDRKARGLGTIEEARAASRERIRNRRQVGLAASRAKGDERRDRARQLKDDRLDATRIRNRARRLGISPGAVMANDLQNRRTDLSIAIQGHASARQLAQLARGARGQGFDMSKFLATPDGAKNLANILFLAERVPSVANFLNAVSPGFSGLTTPEAVEQIRNPNLTRSQTAAIALKLFQAVAFRAPGQFDTNVFSR